MYVCERERERDRNTQKEMKEVSAERYKKTKIKKRFENVCVRE